MPFFVEELHSRGRERKMLDLDKVIDFTEIVKCKHSGLYGCDNCSVMGRTCNLELEGYVCTTGEGGYHEISVKDYIEYIKSSNESNEISKLLRCILSKMDSIEELIKYQPGGKGYDEAKESFTKLKGGYC